MALNVRDCLDWAVVVCLSENGPACLNRPCMLGSSRLACGLADTYDRTRRDRRHHEMLAKGDLFESFFFLLA